MIKLLLVEDDPTLSYIIQSGLQEIIGGYEVITAGNGAEGLLAWQQHHPDIIISDIDMPVMNGFQRWNVSGKQMAILRSYSHLPLLPLKMSGKVTKSV